VHDINELEFGIFAVESSDLRLDLRVMAEERRTKKMEEDDEDGKSYQKGKTLVNPKKLRKSLLLPHAHQTTPSRAEDSLPPSNVKQRLALRS
jgi:hypothetical protein